MGDHRSTWHMGNEAVYDYLERSLSGAAMIEAQRHLQDCPECDRRLREARVLFAQIADLATPALEADLAPKVVASLMAARRGTARWRWVLGGQAAAATLTLAALGVYLQQWVERALHDPAFLAVRQAGAQLLAESSGWLAPLLDLVPTFPMRLVSLRLPVPHLEGPASGWAALAATALLFGLLGNVLLLRSPGGAVPTMADGRNGTATSRR